MQRPDPGQALLDARIAASSVEERVAWVAAKRRLGFQLVWQQVDQAGIRDPVEQARFILGRLYPDMPQAWFQHTIDELARRHGEGRWHGFERP
ncbi:hypothetical protein BH23CHL8_BH23CHL8_08000 [soil metagenome]